VKLPRLALAGGGFGETGGGWPSHCRSIPELDQLQARLSALMPYRVAADCCRLTPGGAPRHCVAMSYRSASGSAMRRQRSRRPRLRGHHDQFDSTFIRSREDGERHLEVRVGNVETVDGGRQVFGAVTRAETDITALIQRISKTSTAGDPTSSWLRQGLTALPTKSGGLHRWVHRNPPRAAA
jgi:hypothetical protein